MDRIQDIYTTSDEVVALNLNKVISMDPINRLVVTARTIYTIHPAFFPELFILWTGENEYTPLNTKHTEKTLLKWTKSMEKLNKKAKKKNDK